MISYSLDKFTAEFSLTKIERDMVKKPQTARVIDNMLTKPIFSKNLCPWVSRQLSDISCKIRQL